MNIIYLFKLAWASILTSAIGRAPGIAGWEDKSNPLPPVRAIALAYRIIGKATLSPDTPGRARTVGMFAVARRRRTQLRGEGFMLGFNRWHLLTGLAATLCMVGIVSLALIYFFPAPPSKIAIASSVEGVAFETFAQRYREKLPGFHVTLDLRPTAGGIDNLKPIEDENSGVNAAFLFSGITDSTKSPGLMSFGRIGFNPIWVFYRGTETLDRLSQLFFFFIYAPWPRFAGPSRSLGSRYIVVFSELTSRLRRGFGRPLKDGEVDVIVTLGELNNPYIQSLLHDPTI